MLGPDSKSQVTVQYENGKPVGVREIVVSHQHLVEDMTSNQVRERVEPYVREALPKDWINGKTIWHINPTGKFFIGGPDGDSGLTGRKIIVDTYGGAAPHGGGAFSGKDPTKVDRSAAYAARYRRQEHRRGRSRRPLHAAARLRDRRGAAAVDLYRHPRHRKGRRGQAREGGRRSDGPDAARHPHAISISTGRSTRGPSSYGHFGRTPDNEGGFSWEKTDLAETLKRAI